MKPAGVRSRSPPAAAAADGHVHFCVALHRTEAPLLCLRTCLVHEAPREESAEEQRYEDDHERPAHELAGHEPPAEKYRHDDSELDDEVGRGDLERHRRGEVRALAEE